MHDWLLPKWWISTCLPRVCKKCLLGQCARPFLIVRTNSDTCWLASITIGMDLKHWISHSKCVTKDRSIPPPPFILACMYCETSQLLCIQCASSQRGLNVLPNHFLQWICKGTCHVSMQFSRTSNHGYHRSLKQMLTARQNEMAITQSSTVFFQRRF